MSGKWCREGLGSRMPEVGGRGSFDRILWLLTSPLVVCSTCVEWHRKNSDEGWARLRTQIPVCMIGRSNRAEEYVAPMYETKNVATAVETS